jgi:hypothetical protein
MFENLNVHLKPRTWLIRAIVISVALALVHMLATPLYFDQWLGYGAFFVAAAVLQVMFSMALTVNTPNRALLWVGLVGNVLVVLLWIITRTFGIPLGPMAGEVLPLGWLDGIAQVLELVQVVHLFVLLRQFDVLGDRPLVE